MEEEIFYAQANEISRRVFERVEKILKEGMTLLELAKFIEEKIHEFGGSCAFPPNLSVNEIAAHYTPDYNDSTVLKKGDLIKIDIGVHVDGYISDRAKTYIIGEKSHELIKVAHEALEEALRLIAPGNRVWQVSSKIEEIVTSYGFNPIRNLSGHGLGRYLIHTSPTIPNSKNSIRYEFKEGDIIAMEVFVTNGEGWVIDKFPALILSLRRLGPVRDKNERRIVDFVYNNFKALPFARRWIDFFSPTLRDFYLQNLVKKRVLVEYPVLVEKSGGMVAQEEETVIVRA